MISARMLATYLKSPYQLYCDLFVDPKYKDPMTDYQELMFRHGREHELKVVKDLFKDAKEAPETKEEALKQLLTYMKEGVDILHGFPMEDGDLTGYFDIIEKRKGKSKLGDYHYIVKEIKWAKNIKEHHKIQAFFYNHLLGKLQGYTPKKVYLVNRDEETFTYDYDEEQFLEALEGVKKILKGEHVTPTYNKCDWPWQTYCNEQAKKTNDVSLVPDVGLDKKPKLNAIGIHTVEDLAKTDIDTLLTIKGIAETTAQKIKRAAQAIITGKAIKIKNYTLPTHKTELFLDLEGLGNSVDMEGIAPIDYLIGVLVRIDAKEHYKPFLAEGLDKEEAMLKTFLDWLKTQDDYIIYHWHHYERRAIKNMCTKYHIPTEETEEVLSRMIDLHKVATSSYAFPLTGTKVKDIAKWLGFSWRQKEVTGTETIAYYLEYIEHPEDRTKLDKVLLYNEDDVVATRVVKDWLYEHINMPLSK